MDNMHLLEPIIKRNTPGAERRAAGLMNIRWPMIVCARLAVAASMPFAALSATADPRLHAFSAAFEGRKAIALIDARAEAVATLRRSSSYAIYTLKATIRWTAISRSFELCSVVRLDGDRLVPIAYGYADQGDPRRDVRTDFDWSSGKAVTQHGNGEVSTIDIAWPAWDPVSFQLGLINAAPSRRAGDVETHTVIERGLRKTYRVVYEDQATAVVAGSSRPVLAIRGEKDGGGGIRLLLDPARQYRPLRIGIEDVDLDHVADRATPAALAADEVPSCPPPRRP